MKLLQLLQLVLLMQLLHFLMLALLPALLMRKEKIRVYEMGGEVLKPAPLPSKVNDCFKSNLNKEQREEYLIPY